MKTIALQQHKMDILRRANSEGNRFDPFQNNAALARQGATEWHRYLIKDLELIKSSRDQLGSSPQFDQHIDRYAAALIDLAFRPAPQHHPVRRLGQASTKAYQDRRPAVADTPPTTHVPKRSLAAIELSGSLNERQRMEGDGPVKRQKLDRRSRTTANGL
jgi:hypothetical protein